MTQISEIDKKYWMLIHPSDTIGNVSPTDIAVSCPICKEGKSWKRKHRLHLYVKDTYDDSSVNCFNCGYKSTLKNYIKETSPNLYNQYINEKSKNSLNSLQNAFASVIKTEEKSETNIDFDVGFNLDDFQTSTINLEIIPESNYKNTVEIVEGSKPYEYITKKRGLVPQKYWRYLKSGSEIILNKKSVKFSDDYIFIPYLTKDKKVYGFQLIGIEKKRFFIELPDKNKGYKVENLFLVDKKKTVYIFESTFDRLSSSIDNSISLSGASVSKEVLDYLEDVVFCLDNHRVDKKAKEELLKLSKNYKCFIWEKGLEDYKDYNDLLRYSDIDVKKLIESNIHKGLKAEVLLKI